MDKDTSRILVMGVGNILFTDEGIGVRVVESLREQYDFSENVTLYDGGTLGMRLMDPILHSDKLIIVDAVLGEEPPGSIYRLTGENLRKSLSFRNSLHQTDLVDTLIYCEILGNRPDALVVGIEPEDYKTMSVEISKTLAAQIPRIMDRVLEEIRAVGGSYAPRNNSQGG